MDEDKLLTINQAAEYLQVTRAQIYLFFKRKKNPLPYVRLTKTTRRVRRIDLEEWVNNNK